MSTIQATFTVCAVVLEAFLGKHGVIAEPATIPLTEFHREVDKRHNEVNERLQVRSSEECNLSCLLDSLCTSVSYNSYSKACWKSYSDFPDDLTDSPGMAVFKSMKTNYHDCFGGSCYIVLTDSLSWADAKDVCEKDGGHLIDINSQAENEFVVQLAREKLPVTMTTDVYLGGNDLDTEGVYKWSDGSLMFDGYTNFSPGEPNNHQNSEDCVVLIVYETYNNVWNDNYCPALRPSICEYKQ